MKINPDNPYSVQYDLKNCAEEPIHLIHTVQSFACIIAVDIPDLTIRQVSDNISNFLSFEVDELLNHPLSVCFSPYIIKQLQKGLAEENFIDINPIVLPIQGKEATQKLLIAHLKDNKLLLEVEPSSSAENNYTYLTKIEKAIEKVQSNVIENQLYTTLAKEIKTITDYDRVMIYRFDKDYNGAVIAEAKEEKLEPFLGIHYPSTDIPKQARKLFLTNKVRMLVDVDDTLSMIHPSVHPKTKEPLNVGSSAVRGVSPIHLEYLRNMGVRATLNVAIVEDDKLWGLIACHHYAGPKVLDHRVRSLIKFIGNIISGHLSLYRAKEFRDVLLKKNMVHAKLFEQMSQEENVITGLMDKECNLLDYINAKGVTIIFDEKIKHKGQVPGTQQTEQLVAWLNENTSEIIYSSDSFKRDYPFYDELEMDCGGIMSLRLSKDPMEYIIWFREQQHKEVYWGGNPEKTIIQGEENVRLSPRKSFEKWKQVIDHHSLPWEKQDKDAAIILRNDIKDILLKRFSQLKKLNQDLTNAYKELEHFSYTVSHDLRSPLRAIDGFAQVLVEDYSKTLDKYGVEVINTIVSSVGKMNSFIDDILNLSKLANNKIIVNQLKMDPIIDEIVKEITQNNKQFQKISISILPDLPDLYGDRTMIKQLFSNLIRNAVKYTQPMPEPKVEIFGKADNDSIIYTIKDNGIGFEMVYAEKIFEVFSRLVSEEDFEGTGIGLSIVKRIVEKHKGNISVKSAPNQGTTFTIGFPKNYTPEIIT